MRASVLALALLLAVLPRPAAAGARVKVAVVPGIAVNVAAARVDALGQDLADALAAELDVDAMGGLEVRRRLPVDGLPPDCIAKPDCIADVARRAGAAQLLFMVIVDIGAGGIQIDSTWIEPATGRSAARPVIDLAPGADPKSRFVAAARGLLPDAPVRPRPNGGIGGTMTPAVPRHYTTAAKLTTGLAVAGLGAGIGFGLAARSKYRACDVEPKAPVGCDGQHGAIRTRALIADLGYAAAIGGAIATAVLIATSGKESRLVVEPSPQGVAVSAIGWF
ncbi:MAG TPA: hypothetical protein VN253_13040 [Kofleriaceae bacterium]|nr:hypothetical protein [Kofleriaceae bacterium]